MTLAAAAAAAAKTQQHILKLVISNRKVTAQVTNPTTKAIVAMSCSSEQESLPYHRSAFNNRRVPRPKYSWDSTTASRLGLQLGTRLLEIGVNVVAVDVAEEICRPVFCRKLVSPLFVSLQDAGVVVNGADQLRI